MLEYLNRIKLEKELRKQLEEMDAKEVYKMMLDPPKNAEINDQIILAWIGYPTFCAPDVLIITWFYQILVGDRNTKTFWPLVREKRQIEVHEWLTSHGYTSVIARIMDENRPTTKKEEMRL